MHHCLVLGLAAIEELVEQLLSDRLAELENKLKRSTPQPRRSKSDDGESRGFHTFD
ncbi:MAG: hypothetical protein ACJ73D_06410 [Pyrinomonadaceae bacterium]